MSHFLRQLHISSTLKNSRDKDKVIPFYKTIAPILSFDINARQMHVQVLNKNLQLKTPKENPETVTTGKKRNLAIVLSWLLAKGSHIDKYSKLYMSRGFDVLTVTLTPMQMLFPTTGSQVVATNILEYLDSNQQYDKILVHAFSIGGYLMGEIFAKHKDLGIGKGLSDKVCGIVLDSAVDFEGIVTGFPRAISKSPMMIHCLESYIKSHMALMHNVATKHYKRSSKEFHETPLNCPALFLVSDADKVGTPAMNQNLANSWRKKGIDISFKTWEKSAHVSHMHLYKDEYVGEITKFLEKINLNSN